MLTRLVVFFRSLALICAGHRAVALENLECDPKKIGSSGWIRTSNPPVNSRMLYH